MLESADFFLRQVIKVLVNFQALGCRLNEAELETWASQFMQHGHQLTTDAAEADVREVLAGAKDAPHLLVLVGDAQHRLGSIDLARATWHRALFRLSSDRAAARVAILVRLARLEESTGRASVALRHWRAVLDLQPDHPHARRRVAELTGFET